MEEGRQEEVMEYAVTRKLFKRLRRIEDTLLQLLEKENGMSVQLDTLTQEVLETSEVIDSAITLIQGLAAQLTAIKDDPAAIQALADELNAKSEALAAAVQANTPSQPV